MPQANTHTVRGGTTDEQSEYGAGIKYYDTVSGIAEAWKEANPEDRRSLNQIQREIVLANRLRTRNGVACTGDNIQDAVIRVGQTLVLPAGNPVNPEVHYDCPPERKPKPVQAVQIVTPPEQVKLEPQAEASPLAQFVPAPSGAVDLGYAVQRYNYFFGEPPRDVAATGKENAGNLRNGAIVPDEMEGQATKLRRKDDSTGALREGQQGQQFFGRARKDELTYAPENTYLRDANGNLVPNKRYNQKPEENLGSTVNGDGRVIETVMGGALISLARRNNPYHAGLFTDYDTARNVIGKWNASAEAVTVLTQYEGLMTQYERVGDRFFKGEAGTATAADAKALLEMNERLALNPVIWSVSPRGLAYTDISVVQNASRKVFESEGFKALPAEEQAALRATYESRIAQYGNPKALHASIGGDAGVAKLYNPLTELATERAELKFIQRGYGRDGGERPEGVTKEEWRTQVANGEGQRYAAEVAAEATRVPHATEIQVGTGIAFDRKRQTADAVVASRREALTTIRNDQALLDDVITHVVTAQNPTAGTATALQKWTDPLFHASRKGGSRAELLAFKGDKSADRYVENTAAQMGGEAHRDSIDYKGNSVLNAPIGFVASLIGQEQPGGNRNQNRGVADGFPQAVRERWLNGTDAERAEIRAAFSSIIDRSLEADANGKGYAAASLITSLNPRLAEYSGKGTPSEAYQRVQARIGTAALDTMIAQANATEQLSAAVEIGTEQRVKAGKDVRTVDADALDAALKAGTSVKVTGGEAKPDIAATVLNTDAIRAAAGPAAQAGVLLASNNPGRVGQGDTNRAVVELAAATQPTAFSMTVLSTVASGSLDAGALRNLQTYLNTVDKGTGDANRYADMMKHHLKAYYKAAGNPEALAAAEAAAQADLDGYFSASDRKHDGARFAAAGRLAGLMAKDNAVSTAFTTQLQAIAAEQEKAGPAFTLSNETVASLQAINAGPGTPEEKAAKIREVVANVSTPVETRTTTTAPLLSTEQQAQIVALKASAKSEAELAAGLQSITAGSTGTPALNAAQLTALNAAVAGASSDEALKSTLAGFGVTSTTVNAGTGKSILSQDAQEQIVAAALTSTSREEMAGKVRAITAGLPAAQIDELLSLRGGSYEDVMAGIKSTIDTLTAKPGISWRSWGKALFTALVPTGGDKDIPILPDGTDGCLGVPRPDAGAIGFGVC